MTVKEKIARSEKLVCESYYKGSVIDQLVKVRDFRPTDKGFLRIYKRTYVPKDWFIRKDVYSDLVFRQFGSGIALSEKKFFIEEVLKEERIERETCSEVDFNILKQKSRSLHETELEPTVLLAPINHFTKLHADWITDSDLRVESMDRIFISGHNYKISWSNKYIPFKEFIFIDKSFGEWVSKPSFNDRLYVKISESDKMDQYDLLIYTTVKFNILDPNKIAILQISDARE